MKPFVIWLVIAVVIFGGIGGGYHATLTNNPRKVLVAVDSSLQMKSAWPRVPDILNALDNQRYAVFCLVNERRVLHDPPWQATLKMETLVPFGPPDFSKFTGPDQYAEIEQAGQKYLITTDHTALTNRNFKGWTIIRLIP